MHKEVSAKFVKSFEAKQKNAIYSAFLKVVKYNNL